MSYFTQIVSRHVFVRDQNGRQNNSTLNSQVLGDYVWREMNIRHTDQLQSRTQTISKRQARSSRKR